MRFSKTSTYGLIAALGVAGGGWSADQDASPSVRSTLHASSSRVASPTVVLTYVAHNGELALLVLWRGSPGWFMRGAGGHSSGGGGGAASSWAQLSYGGLSFTVELDHTTNVARLLGQQIALKDGNVVLVDYVDSQSGPRIVRVTHVDPALPSSGDPALAVLKRQSELIEFLQCDLTLPDPAMQAAIAVVCGQIRK